MQEPSILNLLRKRGAPGKQEEKWGLILSGGGTKGAYEIGAWRAILELRIPLRGIAGTSIGALNAALFLCCELKQIETIYRTIRLPDVLPIHGTIDPNRNVFDPVNLLAITREYLQNGGLDNEPLRSTLRKYLDIDRIYSSPLDLGIVSYDIRTKEPLRIFKEDVEPSRFLDYLLASANFPIFKSHQVGGRHLMDGGLYDNMPFNLLAERGYTHLIGIDINGLGHKRRIEDPGRVYIKMVSCSEDLGGTFEFNQDRIKYNMTLGYLDTMKAFHRLFGNYYFFRRPAFNDLLLRFDLDTIYGLETAARLYKIERGRIYRAEEFLDELALRHAGMEERYSPDISDELRRMDISELRRLILAGAGIPAMVHFFMEQPAGRSSSLAKAFPDLTAAANAIIELNNYRRK